MLDTSGQRTFLPKSRLEQKVPGLREFAPPSKVKVYRALPDGTLGELLRIEPAFPKNIKENHQEKYFKDYIKLAKVY